MARIAGVFTTEEVADLTEDDLLVLRAHHIGLLVSSNRIIDLCNSDPDLLREVREIASADPNSLPELMTRRQDVRAILREEARSVLNRLKGEGSGQRT